MGAIVFGELGIDGGWFEEAEEWRDHCCRFFLLLFRKKSFRFFDRKKFPCFFGKKFLIFSQKKVLYFSEKKFLIFPEKSF
jgi:hypothetical protein